MLRPKLMYGAYFLVGIFAIIVLLWIWVHYFFNIFDECSQKILNSIENSSGKYITHLQVVDCGAVSDFATQVIVENSDTGSKQQVISLKGDWADSCDMRWSDSLSLQLDCSNTIEFVYSQDDSFEEVQIELLQRGKVYRESSQ